MIDLFKKAHERGINTNLDTSGQPFTREEPFFSKFNELLKYTDLVMLDIKHIDDEEHKKLTGHTNKIFWIVQDTFPSRAFPCGFVMYWCPA